MNYTDETIQAIIKDPQYSEVDYYPEDSILLYYVGGFKYSRVKDRNASITAMTLAAKNIKINIFINSKM